MSLLAIQQDFQPANATEGAVAMYYQQHDGSGYDPNHPLFAQQLAGLQGFAAPNNQKLAIWGCAYSSLVSLCVSAGYDAYGFDASAWAIGQAKATFATIAARFFVRDALSSADVSASRGDAGITGNRKFALLVSQDMLTCMSNAEIATTLPLLRNACSSNLLHMVTPSDYLQPWSGQQARINWKTDAQWKALLSPPDQVYDLIINAVV